MAWLLLGTLILAALLLLLRGFVQASVETIRRLLFGGLAVLGLAVAALLVVSGRGLQALTGLFFVGPLIWRQFNPGRPRGGPNGGPRWGAGGGPDVGQGQKPPPRARAGMTQADALEVLGLTPGASEEDIKAAHRRLMRGAHPDLGGSDWLASRINQARDILLG